MCQMTQVSRKIGCICETVEFVSSMDWRERIKQRKLVLIFFLSFIAFQQLLLLFVLTQQQ